MKKLIIFLISICLSCSLAGAASIELSTYGGNIGIGTSDPQFTLDVAGNINASNALTVNNIDVCLLDGSNCPGVSNGWNDVGSNVYLIDINDNVGIGTINPAGKLHVAGGPLVVEGSFSGVLLGNQMKIDGDTTRKMKFSQTGGTYNEDVRFDLDTTTNTWAIDSTTGVTALDVSDFTVTAAAFVGDGSGLTGVSSSGGGWQDGGTNIHLTATTDTVGIGTTTPNSASLEIVKQGTTVPLKISSAATGNGDYLVVTSGGAVGIGTTDPLAVNNQYYLNLSKNFNGLRAVAMVNMNAGTSTASGFEMVSADSNGFVRNHPTNYSASAYAGKTVVKNESGSGLALDVGSGDPIQFMVANSEKARVDAQGNVGIATVNPVSKLQVVGTVTATSFSGDGSALTGISGSGTVNSGGADFVAVYDTAGTAVSASSVLSDNGTNIGIGTVGPVSKLQVNGTVTATAFSGDGSALTGISGGVGIGTANTITFWPTTTTIGSLPTDTYPSLTELSYVKGATSNIQTQIDGLSVGSGGWTDGGTNVYTSTTTDNVGIGTTTPTSGMKLDVRGGQYVSGNVGVGTTIPSANLMAVGSTVNVFKLVSTTASASNGGAGIQSWNDDGAAVVSGDRLAFYTFGGSYNGTNGLGSGGAISGFADGTYSASSYPTDIRIETAPSGSTTRIARVYVKSTGNVGIGSATPGQALDVQGTVKATAFSGDGSALTGISAGGWVDGGASITTTTTTDTVGIGTTTVADGILQIGGDNVAIGIGGTNNNATGAGELYVKGDLEVDGTIYGDGSGISGLSSGGWTDNGASIILTTTADQVAIGTTTPVAGYALTVLGGIAGTGGSAVTSFTGGNVGIGTTTAGALLTIGTTGQTTVTSAGVVSVPDDAYAAGWNGSTAVPTKNAVYDKIETLGAGYWTDAGVFTYLTTTTDNVGIGTVAPDQRLKVEGSSAANISTMVRNSNSSGLASVKVWNSANLGFEMVATGSGYAVPSTYGVLATAGESLSFGEADGTINMRINPAGTVRFTPTDTPDTCNAGNEGSLYYDNSLNEFCDCDGSSWAQVDGGGAC